MTPAAQRPVSGVAFVDVYRGAHVESVHAVAACVADARGTIVRALGDIDAPVYLRSAVKPFIAAAVVASGAAAAFALGSEELAVMAASHDGEPFHVAAVRGILAKIGLPEAALQCGAHPPSSEPAAAALAAAGVAPTALHHNCSGKHAGILAMCVHLGYDPATYLALEHPAQRRILAACARLVDDDPATMPLGVDGCGIPVFATTLRRAARGFARFATLEDIADADAHALRAVRDAIVAAPRYLAGTERFDTALVEATRGRVVGKAGAEGVHCDALRDAGLGLALKVIDGARRAVAPATVALLREHGALTAEMAEPLAAFASPEIRNAAGRVVGRIAVRAADTILAPHSS